MLLALSSRMHVAPDAHSQRLYSKKPCRASQTEIMLRLVKLSTKCGHQKIERHRLWRHPILAPIIQRIIVRSCELFKCALFNLKPCIQHTLCSANITILADDDASAMSF